MTRECEGGKGERFLHVTVECETRGSGGGVVCNKTRHLNFLVGCHAAATMKNQEIIG